MPTIDNAYRSWKAQPRDRDLKERFLSFVCLFIFAIRFSRFILFTFFGVLPHFSIHSFPSAFSHSHPPSAGIRSAFYRLDCEQSLMFFAKLLHAKPKHASWFAITLDEIFYWEIRRTARSLFIDTPLEPVSSEQFFDARIAGWPNL